MTHSSRLGALLPLVLLLAWPSLGQSLPLTDLLVVYQSYDPADDSRLPEIHALRLGADHALATGEPTVLVRDAERILTPMDLIPDGSGGAYLAWTAMDPDALLGDIQLQHLDGTGKPLWPVPLAITQNPEDDGEAKLAADGLGGCLVAWNRINGEFTSTARLQRVDAKGALQWEAQLPGEDASVSTYCGKALADGQGGAYLLASAIGSSSIATGLVQHVGMDGQPLWKEGARLVFGSGESESLDGVFADGTGGILAVGATMSFKDMNLSSCTVLAQRLDAQGKRLWGGPQGCVRLQDVLGCALRPVALPDGKGGLCLAYSVSDPSLPASSDNLPDTDVLVQHLDAQGNPLWVEEPMLLFGGSRGEGGVGLFSMADGGWMVLAQSLDRHGMEAVQGLGERLSPAGASLWKKPDQDLPPLMEGQSSTGVLAASRRDAGVDLLLLEETPTGTHLLWTQVDDAGHARPGGPVALVEGPLAQRGMLAVSLSGH